MCLTNPKNLQGPILISWTNTNGPTSKFGYHQPNPMGFLHLEGTQQDVHGKTPGADEIGDNAQICRAGGHSNNIWLMFSDSAPHRWHDESEPQCLSTSLHADDTHPTKACYRKCSIFLAVFSFHTC